MDEEGGLGGLTIDGGFLFLFLPLPNIPLMMFSFVFQSFLPKSKATSMVRFFLNKISPPPVVLVFADISVCRFFRFPLLLHSIWEVVVHCFRLYVVQSSGLGLDGQLPKREKSANEFLFVAFSFFLYYIHLTVGNSKYLSNSLPGLFTVLQTRLHSFSTLHSFFLGL